MDKSFTDHLNDKMRPGRRSHLFLAFLGVSLTAVVVWSAVGRLDIVSMAEGQVVPSTRVRTVQHLEGGIVREIMVREGQVVAAGQPLITLEKIISDAYFEEVQSRIVSLRIDLARLEALRTDKKQPEYPRNLADQHPKVVDRSRSLFTASLKAYQSKLASQKALIRQREHRITEILTRQENSRENMALLDEQIALSRELLEEKLTTRYKHLNYLREKSSLEGRIEADKAALATARAALSETRAGLENIRTAHRQEIEQQLKNTRQDLKEILQRQRRHADSLARTILRAPVDGVVKTLHVTTIGGVIRPGVDVVEIVPAGDTLIVEAMLPVGDIGYVHEGQAASVSLGSRERNMFGKLEGRVIHVAPDTTVTPDGRAYYAVRIQTENDRFRYKDLEYRLYPGMIMQVAIHTGSRTVLQYVLDPMLGSMSGMLQER